MWQNFSRKPILWGGLGICGLLWGWHQVQGQLQPISEWGLWGLTAFGFLAWRLKKSPDAPSEKPLPQLTPDELQKTLDKTAAVINAYQQASPELLLTDLHQALEHWQQQATVTPRELQGIVLGDKRTGKSTLLPLLSTAINLSIDEPSSRSLTWQELSWEQVEEGQSNTLLNAHYVLVLASGDLSESQWQRLQRLHRDYHCWQLVLNQQDRFTDDDRQSLLDQINLQVTPLKPLNSVYGISTAPSPLTIRRHLANGEIETTQEVLPPQCEPFLKDFTQTCEKQYSTAHHGVIWRHCQQIQQQAHQRWQVDRRDHALLLIEKAQWLAAGTAMVNPVANLDLLAAVAINGQLVYDLGQLYHQPISLAQAQTVASQLGKLLLQLGLVELSSQALAGLLKTQPLTYLAGGAIQGLSAAYLSRMTGLSLVEFLATNPPTEKRHAWDWSQLSTIIQRTFEQNRRSDLLQAFFQSARQNLSQLTT